MVSLEVSITETLPEVSPPTHSRLPSGVRATLTGSPETAIVFVTVLVAVLMTETASESPSAT